jgi:hypothetical protein
MKKTNDSYCVVFRGERVVERYYGDETGWLKVSNRGRVFRMTAEQVLNHVLSALAFGDSLGLEVHSRTQRASVLGDHRWQRARSGLTRPRCPVLVDNQPESE